MRKKLLKLYDDLYAQYGELNWWPAETPFEIIIGAILGQATAWGNAAKAIDNLKAANLLDPEELSKLSQDELETLILPSGYYRAKAKKVRAFLTHLQEYTTTIGWTHCLHRSCRHLGKNCFRFTESVRRQRMQSCFTLPKSRASSLIHTPTVCWGGWDGSAANTITADSKRFSWTISLTIASCSINSTL